MFTASVGNNVKSPPRFCIDICIFICCTTAFRMNDPGLDGPIGAVDDERNDEDEREQMQEEEDEFLMPRHVDSPTVERTLLIVLC